MDFNEKVPDWYAEGTEPPDSLKESGFQAGNKPPAPYFNWFWCRVSACLKEIREKLTGHATNKENPHGVTAEQVGLGNVSNTSDANKPVSTAQATAIADAKKAGTDAQAGLDSHTTNKNNPHGVTAAQLGLDKVNNTPDTEKYVAFAQEAGTARKNQYSMTVRLNGGRTEGTDQFTYDGSTGRTVNITPEKIGAVSKSGDTMTGGLKFTDPNGSANTTTLAEYNKETLLRNYADASNYVDFVFGTASEVHLRGVLSGTSFTKTLLHTGNKPTGTYTGNGSSATRKITTGGTGNMLLVIGGWSYAALVFPDGCIYKEGTNLSAANDGIAYFRDGVLTIANTRENFNLNGQTYTYYVL